MSGPAWSTEDVKALVDFYASPPGNRATLRAFSDGLGRDQANVCRKAKALGLTGGEVKLEKRSNPHARTRVPLPPSGGASATAGMWSKPGRTHPRGMAGKHHSDATKAAMSRARSGVPRPHSDATREAMSKARAALIRSNPEAFQRGNRGKGGRRVDLGNRYFRSRWEANYARYLRFAGVEWEYEPKTFWFESIRRGTRSYTPDFWIPAEKCYHEVKGWMDDKSRIKLTRMAKFHPDVRIVVVGKDWFAQAERQGLCRVISGWECKHTNKESP